MEIQRTEIPLDPRLVSLYDNLKSFYETGKYVDENDVIDKVKFCFGISGNSVYDEMLSYPYIVAKALEENIDYNRDRLLKKKCYFLKSEVQDLTTKYTRHKGKCIYVRQIIKSEFSMIPINEHIFDKCAYVHLNGTPFVITKITEEIEEDFIEFNNMLPQEIRLLSSLSFPLEIGAGTFSIKACGSFFTMPLLDGACEDLTEIELAEVKLVISLLKRMHNYSTTGNEKPIVPRGLNDKFYSYMNFFYDLYDEENEVFNRCMYLLYKSNILFFDSSRLFCEEAYLLLTIATEGLLKLLTEKQYGKFEVKKAFDYINDTFKFGDYMAKRLKEIYELRIELVHPINKYDLGWKKDIMFDDFADDIEIAKALAYHYVTGQLLDHEEM